MKFFAIVSFLLPMAVAGQSKTDYENIMAKFQNFYNSGKGDSINAMFAHRQNDIKSSRALWTNDGIVSLLEEFGILKSFKYIGIDNSDSNKVHVFETIFSKAGAKTTSLTLYNDYSIGTLRFITTSESINELLRKFKSSR